MDCKCNFKWPSYLHAKMAVPDLQRYPWNLNLIKKYLLVLISPCFLNGRNVQLTFADNLHMQINSLNKQKHANLICTLSRKTIQGNCCKSGIVIFALRDAYYYSYSLFKLQNISLNSLEEITEKREKYDKIASHHVFTYLLTSK